MKKNSRTVRIDLEVLNRIEDAKKYSNESINAVLRRILKVDDEVKA